ncbi:MAG: hypothetical protein ACK5MU_04320 [Candidatus Saccharimonadales bacterium]
MEQYEQPPEIIETQEQTLRDEPFLARLQQGEDFLRKTAEISDDSEIELSTEQKLLFSMFDASPTDSFAETETATVGLFGLQAGGKEYPFTPEYKKKVHEWIIMNMAERSDSPERLFEKLSAENSKWERCYADLFYDKYAAEISAEYEAPIAQAKADSDAKFMKQKRYGDEFRQFMIERGFLTQEEIVEYGSFQHKHQEIIRRLKDRRDFRPIKTPEEESNIKKDNKLIYVDGKPYETGNLVTLGELNTLFTPLRSLIKEECGQEFKKSVDRGRPISSIMRHYATKDFSDLSLEASKQEIRNFYHDTIGEKVDVEKLLSDYEALCRRQFGDLLPGHAEGEIFWGYPTKEEKLRLKEIIDGIRKERDDTIKKEAPKRALGEIMPLKSSIAAALTGSGEDISDAYVLPTGIIVRKNDDRCHTEDMSPTDSRLTSAMTDERRTNWEQAWRMYYEQQSIGSFDSIVRRRVNQEISADVTDHEADLSDYERELIQLKAIYSFTTTKLIDETTGNLHSQLDSYDVSMLSDIMPYWGRFISSASKPEAHRAESAQTIRKQIESYLSGGSGATGLLSASGEKLSLNLSAFGQVLDAVGDKPSEAAGLLSAGVAIGLYSGLSKELTEEFSLLIGEKASVSKMAFYRAYGQKVENPVQRRNLACRTFFVSEFNKYISKQSDREMADFFDRM